MELKIFNIKSSCTGCGACVSICPRKCLSLEPDKDGFYYPVYSDAQSCIECHQCEKVCHVISPLADSKVSEENFYSYYAIEDNIRKESSSGGAFSLFAEQILKNNGIVFASRYDGITGMLLVDNSDSSDWSLFRKSKYIESYMGDTCSNIAKQLKGERWVLFCGTPCQVRSVKHYMERKNIPLTKLLTIDFVCHGVPTNKCFSLFKCRYESSKRKIENVDFRYKDFSKERCGWHDLCMKFDFSDGKKKILPYKHPSSLYYLKVFADDLAHRLCCLNCHYPESSMADITVGDFWGIKEYMPNEDDNKGISLIKIHTPKALCIWENIKNKGICKPIPYQYAEYIYRKIDITSVRPRRDRFLEIMNEKGLDCAVKTFYHTEFVEYYTKGWIKDFVKLIIGRK